MAVDITALYCCLDDFCKVFEDWEAHRLIPTEHTRQRTGKLSRAEMLFIVVLFHLSPFKHFKAFYCYGIGHQHRACFNDLPHYDRFVSLMPRLFAPLMILLHSLSGEQTGLMGVVGEGISRCACQSSNTLQKSSRQQYSAVISMAIEGVSGTWFDAQSSQTDAVKALVPWEFPSILIRSWG